MLILVTAPASSQVYKWTDSQGNVHFGDKPIDNHEATEVKVNTSRKTGVTNSSGNKRDRDLLLKEIEKNKQDKAKKDKKRQLASNKKKKLCKRYKSAYQLNIQNNRSYVMSPNGERKYLTTKQRDANRRKLSKGMSKYCRSVAGKEQKYS